MTGPDAEGLRARLVPWYRGAARDLPWRREVTPYRVLLSELMLQQTRVETVIPYFEAFTRRWPTLEALAAADEAEVLRAWAGLGYYRRARSLLAACRAAVARGGLAADLDALRALPGVGPYTAGAIASLAYGLPVAAVDGNVERVISRVDARAEDPATPAGRRAIAARVAAITAPGVAADVTSALMELGATVCVPKRPRCERCPWADVCVGRALGVAEGLPRKRAKAPPRAIDGVAGILERDGLVLLGRRPPGLLGGLWEPPGERFEAGGGEGEPRDRLGAAWRDRVGIDVEVAEELGTVVHVFTHRKLTLRVYRVRADAGRRIGGDGSYEELGWFPRRSPGVGLSRLAEKVLALAPTLPVVPRGATPG